jgi:filamentous hemagglutinin family protein
MPVKPVRPTFRPIAHTGLRSAYRYVGFSRAVLLGGVSALTLFAAPAQARNILSAASGNAASNAASSAITSAQQAAAATQQSMNALSRATQALQAMQLTQSAMRNLALSTPSTVPNGLGAGGLQVAPGVGSDPTLWQNANLPTQSTTNGKTTVTIQQTAQKAILTWNSFNVGTGTDLYFNQSAGTAGNGGNNWIVLNRVVDPTGVPSQILGSMRAEGGVYVINANGVIFGGGSQVNVNTLVASSLSFLGENIAGLTPGSAAYDTAVAASNATFINTGIAANEATGASSSQGGNLVLGLGSQIQVPSATTYQVPGDITIQAGASITTHENGTQGNGGFVLIAAPNVSNAGSIIAPDGQAILAAGVGVSFLPGGSQILNVELSGRLQIGTEFNAVDVTPVGTLTNTGLIPATRGYINLLATNINQNGVVEVTTGVSYPGGIIMSAVDEALDSDVSPEAPVNRRAGLLSFGPGAVTADLPEEDGETATSSSTNTFKPGTITLTGGSVWFQGGSLLDAPGANVTVGALSTANSGLSSSGTRPAGDNAVPGRIYVDNGAIIDVSGLPDVELPMSDILFAIPLLAANEVADSPLQRNGFLTDPLHPVKNVVLDSTLSGVTADGLAWVGSPLLNASGYADLIPRGIDQLLINGGTITLSGGEVVTAPGSSLNLNGGYIHYLGGMINTTRLVDASGHLVDIGKADPNDVYIGVAGQFTVTHDHWGANLDETYGGSLLSGGYYQPDYIQGGNAGTLNIFGQTVAVLDGAMSAQAFAGLKQVAAGVAPSGTASGGNFLPEGGTFDLGDDSEPSFGNTNNDSRSGEAGKIIIQANAPQLSSFGPNFSIDTPFDATALNALDPNDPNNVLAWTTVPTTAIDNGGFANVTITEDKSRGQGLIVAPGATFSVQPGGAITLAVFGGNTSILGNLIAPSGKISVTENGSIDPSMPGNIVVGPGATISTAGEWINNSGLASAPGADAYVNGGSISLTVSTSAYSGPLNTIVDDTGSILLQAGSVLDVSSGGVLLANGLLMKNGIPEGQGGSLSLEIYAGAFGAIPVGQPVGGKIVMDGTIESAGFSGGGKLTLQALGIQIGGNPAQAPAWDFYLPTDFFARQGFGAYQLNAVYDTIVAPGTDVRLTQLNLIPDLAALEGAPTGADLNSGGLTSLGTLDPYHRQATDLNLVAGQYVGWLPSQLQSPIRPTYAGVTGGVTLGEGASIDADAGAAIGLGSPFQVTVLGSIVAPGGSIILTGDTETGQALPGQTTLGSGFTTFSKSVWLGSDAVLDVAGVALTNPLAAPVRIGNSLQIPLTGKVLDGGSVILSDDTGYLVAEAGSVIDVSGASGTFDELQANGSYAPQQMWSNAGSITLATGNGLYFDGTLKAEAGAPQGEGGTLTLLPETFVNKASTPLAGGTATATGATAVILQQSGDLVPAGLAPGGNFAGTPTGVIPFSLDRLDGSGIGTLVVGNATSAFIQTKPVPVAFAGNVNLSLANAFVVVASQIIALPAGAASIPTLTAGQTSIGGTTVSISAPYIDVEGPAYGQGGVPALVTTASLADGTLNLNAAFIDVENQVSLENFGQANFTSSGDIRLSSVNANGDGSAMPGVLYMPGNLTLKAADIYPASDSSFILDAVGPQPTTITILGNGASTVPLSAGGALLIDATNIVQSGTIRAPSGAIVFGVGDATDSAAETEFASLPLVNTQSVSLTSGSLTSVSLGGTIVPYGVTIDGKQWQYNPIPGVTNPDLKSPPAKVITVNGANVSLGSGATIDLSGGGDLQAEEWVPGTGGTRDVLSQGTVVYTVSTAGTVAPLYTDNRNIYAVIPGYSAPVAAYDPIFAQGVTPSKDANGNPTIQNTSLGVGQAGSGSLVGQAVYLSGVPGLPAGVYTLLPAKYATLPGAFRVVQNTAATSVVPGQSAQLPDGTEMVSGYFMNALNGGRSSTPSQFEVQSGAVWQQYSEYTLTSANSFDFTEGGHQNTVVPLLPIDAGRLVLAATNSLILDTTLKAATALGGAAAQVDIASQDIQIVGSGEAALAGYLQISADSLDQLGAGSLLIGGTRTLTPTGTVIDALANSVVVSNDAANPLTGPEIILVTKTDPDGTDPNAANGLRIDGGSVIAAKGAFSASSDVPITIGQYAVAAVPASGAQPAIPAIPAVSGDGALLMVTNGGLVGITRNDATVQGLLTVDAGAQIDGGQALVLDSSGNLKFDPTARFSGKAIAIDAGVITLTNKTGAAAAALPGFVIGQSGLAQFANSSQVDLRSYTDISFVGDVNLTFGVKVDLSAGAFTSDGGAVTLNATEIAFTNDLGFVQIDPPSTGLGSLTVNANEIDFGAGGKVLDGFATVTMIANGGIVGQGTGTFDLGAANATLTAPAYLADTNSDATLKSTGTLNLDSGAGTALSLAPVGGAISFIGGTLNDNGATIAAPAGNVSLEATSGDLTIASGSLVSSAGISKQFFDIVAYAPAGNITLTADTGLVNVQSGATLDFSGASGGGTAGSLTLSAPQQVVNLNGTLKGGAAAGYLGGSFSLNTGGAVDLDSLAVELTAGGVNDAITVQTGAGNLSLKAGNTLTAHLVSLTADGGGGQDSNNGNVNIFGMIDASGNAGGEIDLYGKSGVDLEGSLIATGSSVTQRGGTVNIGTSATFNEATGTYNTESGYENVTPANSGTISLGANALINVSGGTSGGLSNGTVNLRAPLLEYGSGYATATTSTPVTIGIGNQTFTAQTGLSLATGQAIAVVDATTGGAMTGTVTSYNPTTGVLAVNVTSAYGTGTAASWTIANPSTVNVNVMPGASIVGSRATTLEAYAVWSTTDATTGAQHFDGIVDPAGWYNASGALLAGTFADASGNTVASWDGTTLTNSDHTTNNLAYYLTNDYFTPTAANTDASRTAHETFYGYQNGDATAAAPGTLMGFVENFPIVTTASNGFANLANAHFAIAPGIELDNPSAAINGGNISILTNWNLGSGSSATSQDFRYNGQAPIITFRAENNVKVDASLSDGFFQIINPIGGGGSIPVPAPSDYSTTYAAWTAPSGPYAYLELGLNIYASYGLATAPAKLTAGDPAEIAEYYALYTAYENFLLTPVQQSLYFTYSKPGSNNASTIYTEESLSNAIYGPGTPMPAGGPVAPTPPSMTDQAAHPGDYLLYLASYQSYLSTVRVTFGNSSSVFPTIPAPAAPIPEPVAVFSGNSVPIPAITDNTPSPTGASNNPLPMLAASLAGGASSSYRIVAGSNFASANPMSLSASSDGSVSLNGHVTWTDPNHQSIFAPVMVRTGMGFIDIAAANDVSLTDPTAPGVIYTGGAPDADAPQGAAGGLIQGNSNPAFQAFDLLSTSAVNPNSGGDISVIAGHDIVGMENALAQGNTASQFWWQWMQTANSYTLNQITQTSINFGAFDQGIMSVGGNVSVSAGGSIVNLAVSLPTTWYLSNNNTVVNTVGGGNLTVSARRDILSGDYFVAKGTGTITAGGLIGSSGLVSGSNPLGQPDEVSTILAAQDGVFNVSARQGVDIGAMIDPSYLQGRQVTNGYGLHTDAQSYSPASALTVISTTGDVAFNTLSSLESIGAGSAGIPDDAEILPATIELTAFSGGITVARGGLIYPSATGQLSLIADQSVAIYGLNGLNGGGNSNDFGLIDAAASTLPSPLNPMSTNLVGVTGEFTGSLSSNTPIDHSVTPLHADDTQPVRIYSLEGSVIDGFLEPTGQQYADFNNDMLLIAVDKPAQIHAAKDIVDLAFLGQNLRDDDITSIIAGRDIIDSPLSPNPVVVPSLQLGGPGTFDIEAGRNIGPLTNLTNGGVGNVTGIEAIGNADNPYLAHDSASIELLYGISHGVANAAFVAAYVDPSVASTDVQQELVAFMDQYDAGHVIDTGLVKDKPVIDLALDQAWTQFQALPVTVQQIFNQQALFTVLTDVGNAYNDPTSPFFKQYARGYKAINTLFPAAYGYTANSLNGGQRNGEATTVSTGDLDMRSTTIQTQQGGNVTILGPGGQALVGSSSASPALGTPNESGILTLETGNIDIFIDKDLLLAQSRIFTEQGGSMTIWSSNGDINAGKGAKTSADLPAPIYVCDDSLYCTRDARGEVTGAGIATLQSIPGAPRGNIDLIAPRGTVDAGAAGIRVSGNLVVAALQVLNADNIQVQGTTVGVPHAATVDVGALTSAANSAGAAANAATGVGKQASRAKNDLPSIITVEVIGYGGGDGTSQDPSDSNQHKRDSKQSYSVDSPVQVIGNGELTSKQKQQLTAREQENFRTP